MAICLVSVPQNRLQKAYQLCPTCCAQTIFSNIKNETCCCSAALIQRLRTREPSLHRVPLPKASPRRRAIAVCIANAPLQRCHTATTVLQHSFSLRHAYPLFIMLPPSRHTAASSTSTRSRVDPSYAVVLLPHPQAPGGPPACSFPACARPSHTLACSHAHLRVHAALPARASPAIEFQHGSGAGTRPS